MNVMAPTDPATLTAADREEIAELQALGDDAFRGAVADYVVQPDDDGSGARVFRCADLVDRTWATLNDLVTTTSNRIEVARAKRVPPVQIRSHRESIRDLEILRRNYTAERKICAQIRETVRRQQAAATPRRAAMEIMADLDPVTYRRIVRALQSGRSRAEVLHAEKQRLGS